MRYKSLTRVLALDLHPRRFGYVVLERPARLLNWGVCSYRGKGKPNAVLIQRRLRPLLEMWNPTLLVTHTAPQLPPRQKLLRERLIKGVVAEAKSKRARVRILKSTRGWTKNLTKYERAREVAELFPVLIGRQPQKRKPWESEHYSMSVFTAAALAMAPGTNEESEADEAALTGRGQ